MKTQRLLHPNAQGLRFTRRAFLIDAAALGALAHAIPATAAPKANTSAAKSIMRTSRIPQTDLTVSRIGYGCVGLASWNKEPVSADETAQAARIIHTAYDNGITLFDHADLYAFGKSEQVFGAVLKQSPGLREKIVIQTKCGQILAPKPGEPKRVNLTRRYIVGAAEGSLRRFGTDRIDILLLHAPDILMEPDEIAQAFDELHSTGKVRYFGVSNFSATQLELLRKSCRQPIIVNQVRVGLAFSSLITTGAEFAVEVNRGAESDGTFQASGGLLDYCRLNGIQVQAWAPLRDVLNRNSDPNESVRQAAQRLEDLARQKDTTVPTLALAWLLRHPAGIVPLTGATKPEHIIDNCTADRVNLTHDEWYDCLTAGRSLQQRGS